MFNQSLTIMSEVIDYKNIEVCNENETKLKETPMLHDNNCTWYPFLKCNGGQMRY